MLTPPCREDADAVCAVVAWPLGIRSELSSTPMVIFTVWIIAALLFFACSISLEWFRRSRCALLTRTLSNGPGSMTRQMMEPQCECGHFMTPLRKRPPHCHISREPGHSDQSSVQLLTSLAKPKESRSSQSRTGNMASPSSAPVQRLGLITQTNLGTP